MSTTVPRGAAQVLAPNDAAFDALLRNLGGGRKLPRDQLLKLPELASILRYHVLPGQYTTQYMFNNTPIYSAQSVDVTPFTDPCMTGEPWDRQQRRLPASAGACSPLAA